MADQTVPQHEDFCWTEIATGDLPNCKEFYQNVFGWTFSPAPEVDTVFDYREFSRHPGSDSIGGMYQISPDPAFLAPLPTPHLLNYIVVENVDDIVGKSYDLGATIIRPPMNVPNVGRIGIIEDPVGAVIAFITLNPAH